MLSLLKIVSAIGGFYRGEASYRGILPCEATYFETFGNDVSEIPSDSVFSSQESEQRFKYTLFYFVIMYQTMQTFTKNPILINF
jgi:hypothetical protein